VSKNITIGWLWKSYPGANGCHDRISMEVMIGILRSGLDIYEGQDKISMKLRTAGL